MSDELAKLLYISGNDDADDRAWGMSLIKAGSPEEVAKWLLDQRR